MFSVPSLMGNGILSPFRGYSKTTSCGRGFLLMQVHQHENANKGGKVADDVYSSVESFGEELLGQFYSVVIS